MKKLRTLVISPHQLIHGLVKGDGQIRLRLGQGRPLDLPNDAHFAGIAMDPQSGFLIIHYTADSIGPTPYWNYPDQVSAAVETYDNDTKEWGAEQ